MNSKTLFNQIVDRIALMETEDELRSVAFLVVEQLFGLNQTDVLTEKPIEISEQQATELDKIIRRINTNEPVQYVLGVADFLGRKFKVNKHVLIPRPETEELVMAIIHYHHQHPGHAKPYRDFGNDGKQHSSVFKILDIGTGSGCIPISLKLGIPHAEIHATDISQEALVIAEENAKQHAAAISLAYHNILTENIPHLHLDVIVSNPPYVMESEKGLMKKNVLDYEPHTALFVPDNDPLVFYKAIAAKGLNALKNGGRIFVEVNEKLSDNVMEVFRLAGYHNEHILNDVSHKPRIVTATK